MMATTHQTSLLPLLEDFESRLREMARMAQQPRLRGPRTKTGDLRARGRTLGYCANLDCGGERSVWPYKNVMVCQRHWRMRRRLADLWKSTEARK